VRTACASPTFFIDRPIFARHSIVFVIVGAVSVGRLPVASAGDRAAGGSQRRISRGEGADSPLSGGCSARSTRLTASNASHDLELDRRSAQIDVTLELGQPRYYQVGPEPGGDPQPRIVTSAISIRCKSSPI
jgi:hypothetical protein